MKKILVSALFLCTLFTNQSVLYGEQYLPQQVKIVENLQLLTILRDKTTTTKDFVEANNLLALQLASEAIKHVPLQEKTIETPMKITRGYKEKGGVVLISILRSSEALVLPFRNTLFNKSRVGHIGLERHEDGNFGTTYKTYYYKTPQITPDDIIIVLDPMLATGGSATKTIQLLKDNGAKEKNIIFVCVIAVERGINRLLTDHPNMCCIITSAIDPELNKHCFIVPGLGDYGDRYYGTPVGHSGLID